MWFGTSPDLALWSFALLPIPMLALAVLAMLGREGVEDEVRFIRRPQFKWLYRIGGIVMLLVTMNLAGII
jgi:ABC-type Fe3+ transport system permease subunit